MNYTAAVAIATVAFGFGAQAGQLTVSDRTVIVHINNEHFAMPAAALAKARASEMFSNIGIRLVWHSGRRQSLPQDAIIVDIAYDASSNECAGALACAKPYEGTHIQLFYCRIRTAVPNQVLPSLLAHVLVHEISHILQGVSRHSETGIMKAHWDAADLAQMTSKALPFAQEDTALIQRGLMARDSRSILAPPAGIASLGGL